jgi:hypothetical protein
VARWEALGDAGWQWLGVAGVAGNPKVTEEILRYGGDVLEKLVRVTRVQYGTQINPTIVGIHTKPVFDEPVWTLFAGGDAFFKARTTIVYLFY